MGGRKRKPHEAEVRTSDRWIVCAKAGISTPDWRPLVVALPSAVYSRAGISVRPFVPWPTFILFNAPLLLRRRETERENALVTFPIAEERTCIHVVRLSLIETLKASLCPDRAELVLEFDERAEIGNSSGR